MIAILVSWFDGPDPDGWDYSTLSALWAGTWVAAPFMVLMFCYDLLLGHFCGWPLPPWGVALAAIVGAAHLLYLVVLFAWIYRG